MINALLLLGCLVQPTTIAAESANLTRLYKEREVDSYTLVVTLNQPASKMEVSADLDFKVLALADKGKAQASLAAKNFSMKGDQASGAEGSPQEFKSIFEEHGMPDTVRVKDFEFIYAAYSVSSYLPGRTVKVGETYDIKWEAPDKSAAVLGKGKLVAIQMMNGVKSVKLENTVDVTPQNDSPGHLSSTVFVRLDNGQLLKADGKVVIDKDDSIANYSIKSK